MVNTVGEINLFCLFQVISQNRNEEIKHSLSFTHALSLIYDIKLFKLLFYGRLYFHFHYPYLCRKVWRDTFGSKVSN